MLTEITFELPHIKLAGLTNNQQGKPVILALHGWLDNAASFSTIATSFEDYHFIALDLPGHGKSDHRDGKGGYFFADWVKDVVELIIAKQWETPFLLGHSMGGMIATTVAATFPELIAGVVLIESVGLVTTDISDTTSQLRKAIKARLALSTKEAPVHKTIESAITARCSASDFSAEIAEILVSRGLMACEGGYTWRTDMRLRHPSAMRFSPQQAAEIIQNIEHNVLLLKAENGYQMISKNMALFEKDYKNLTIINVPGGHHCHLEYPGLLAEHILNFIRKI